MTVSSLKSQANPKSFDAVCTIGLSDGSVFSIKPSYMSSVYRDNIALALNKELSSEEEADFRFAAACFEAECSALRLVARAEQTALGLSLKLKKKGYASSCVQMVISRLLEKEVISDSRYAHAWLEARLSRKAESPRSLSASLRNKGIDRNIARETLKSILSFEEEVKLLKRYIEKNNLSAENEKDGIKTRLKHEGFSAQALQSVLEEMGGHE